MKLIKSAVLLAIALVFITPHSQAQVDTFTSPHFPGKKQPSLYVLSIGIPFVNLKYTVKDTRDFASIFETQGGMNLMYKEVHTTTLAQKSETARLEIRKAFRELQAWQSRGHFRKRRAVGFHFHPWHAGRGQPAAAA